MAGRRGRDRIDDRLQTNVLNGGDDPVEDDGEEHPHHDVADREPPDRLELLVLRADVGDGSLAQVVDVELGVVQSSTERRRHRRLLEERGHLGELLDAQRGGRSLDRPVGADGGGCTRNELRFVELA